MSATPSAAAPQSAPSHSPAPTPGQASRFLAQATFGATPAQIDAVVAQGYAAWLDAQLALPPSQTHFDWLLQQKKNTEAFKGNGINAPLESTLWRKFISAEDQVRTRVAFALSEIFVVGVQSITASWPLFGAAGFMDLLAEHALGDYQKLLTAVTMNLSMGCMLTYRGNRKEDPKTGRHPDENYAREIMQLFSIGLLELNADGTVKKVNGAPVETYTNADVQGLAKVFTGWDINGPETDVEFHRRPMALNNALHSMAEKRFLGTVVPAGTDGHLSLKRAMDAICAHPNVGPFIGIQLIQRLVTSNPSPAYVSRVSAVFDDDGDGVRGNMKAVVRAILLDREARNPDLNAPSWGKIREPILRFSGWARAFGATSTNGAWAMPDTTDNTIRLAQSPMRSATVFNFFRPRYTPPVTELANRHLVAPELQITDETSIAGYLNFLAIYADRGWEDLQTSYAPEIALAQNPQALVARVVLLLAGDAFSAQTAESIAQAVGTLPASRPRDRVRAAVMLVASTPEYLVQK
ncbi:DUF1800 domain-containing protein [Achromobacter seleniivolatilans]|uniref:DUF1800 domain-containing protein n=1 Tax=Achromobacter seleniivolatilans TaxID=3047478 RepID=A0ABY9M0F3_9BURK|nr:DUF1800 domain-containing protein [Achromobacter sp. R39]WMD20474.1 DUF1800 domain-containing protein [Achromobacter sp. R39]